MSYEDGIAAINLEMPPRIPRTEYSAESHWPLIREVTGININHESDKELKLRARYEFYQKWNYDFYWSILTHSHSDFNGRYTQMGHAAYADGGTDYDNAVNYPFKDVKDALSFDPWKEYGVRNRASLIEKYQEHYRQNQKTNPDGVNMTGIYVTCISGLIEIFGWDMMLMAAGTDPAGFGKLTNLYCDWIMQYCLALAESNVPVVMIHDDIVWSSGAFMHPDWYRAFVFPNYKRLFAPLIESGKKIIYTSDGNYTQFVDDIADCGVNGFVLEPTTDISYIAEKYGKTHAIIGNADTRILLDGNKGDIYNEVKRCMDIGRKCPGFIMCVGNHIPANTPVENAIYYNECYEKMSKR